MSANNKNEITCRTFGSSSDGDDDDSIDSDSNKLGNDKSSTDGTTSKKSTTEESEHEKFTQRETQVVFRLRVLVVLVMAAAAASVSAVVFLTTDNGETEEFESQYNAAADKVVETFEEIVSMKLDAMNSLAVAATSHGIDQNVEWPFVSLSNFQQRAVAARKQSGALFVSIIPKVEYDEREQWENYTQANEDSWIVNGLDFQDKWDPFELGVSLPTFPEDVHPGYIRIDDWERGYVRDDGYGPYYPLWQTSPLLKGLVNFNLGSIPQWKHEIETSMQEQAVVIGRMVTPPAGTALNGGYLTKFFATILSIKHGESIEYEGDPFSYVFFPVFNSFEAGQKTVAVMYTAIHWASYFENLLPANIQGLTFVLQNGCDDSFTYTINGRQVKFEGVTDMHDTKFSHMEKTISMNSSALTSNFTQADASYELVTNECPYSIHVYPSQAFYDEYNTTQPIFITCIVAFIFLFAVFMFAVYDRLVERRQRLLLSQATASSAVLATLFPKKIRDALMEDAGRKERRKSSFVAPNHGLKSFLNGDESTTEDLEESALADLFPCCTVFFGDISGFTAWSSVRDPSHVFVLLQNLYQAFDRLAKRRRVFKVETIGDSYVAVTGLPQPQENHAVIMARFAVEVLARTKEICRQLSLTLGPGTEDLALRIGLNSGPVTAGVLRGDKSRFQLFGDTVNTAARMESTGVRDCIQLSQKTASLLMEAGKDKWVKARDDAVLAKGKGVLNTYWLAVNKGKRTSSACSGSSGDSKVEAAQSADMSSLKFSEPAEQSDIRQQRLVDWVVELMRQYIKKIVAQHHAKTGQSKKGSKDFTLDNDGLPLDEVTEVISLPKFDSAIANQAKDFRDVEIDEVVVQQLQSLISDIATTYRDNPFHNFEHACHVTMAAHKFLQRIVAPDLELDDIEKTRKGDFALQLHDYTHGVNDPITICAIIFSAVIHDSDHKGVSNAQLGKEDDTLASKYSNKSIAEQHSLDICWDMLMTDDRKELRQCMFSTEEDFKRFRQVVVNVVLATDIFDKELNSLRKARWDKAFTQQEAEAPRETADGIDKNGLRATIVIEHIMQAADVSHTMQHWHVYRKWNQKLFMELHAAYQSGRMGANPIDFWYKGELGFFDNYIIPLAKKLKDCNVFGVSSDECLNYALQNRAEWEARGEEIIDEMTKDMKDNKPGKTDMHEC